MGQTQKKKKIFGVLTTVIVLIVCVAMAEWGIRVYHWTCERDRFTWLPDEFLGYTHSSNNHFKHNYTEVDGTKYSIDHQSNRFGFFDDEIPLKKEEGTFRILVLGDSFSEAIQVSQDKNFCGQLETLLNADPNKKYNKIEVLNTGVSGYCPLNYFLYFKRELARFKPDLVLVQLFANDVFEDNVATAVSLLDDEGLPLKTHRYFTKKYYGHPPVRREDFNEDPFLYRVKRFLIDRSRAFEYFYVKFYNMQKASPFHQKMIRLDQYGTGYQFFILDPEHVLSRDEAFREKAWGLTRKYLLALKKEVEDRGAQFKIFYIPLEAQLDLDHYGTHVSLYVQKHVGTYFDELLAGFARENKIPFLDLLGDLEENKQKGLYLSRDGHLTENGHEVVARALFRYVKEEEAIVQEN